VGSITTEQLRNVECYVCPDMGIFIPAVGPCYYSITPEHAHPSYSFIINGDENCSISIGGKIQDSRPGKMTALSPGIVHHEIQQEQFARYTALFVPRELFENEYLQYEKTVPVFRGREYDVHDNLRIHIREFMQESEHDLPGRERLLESLSVRITHGIIRSIVDCNVESEKVNTRLDIDRVVEYMNSHFQEELAVDDLARVIGLSASHFSRLFKKETGSTPLDFLIDVRLGKARKMLARSDASITDIAFRCGFNSSSHFSFSFNNRFEISPTEYRKVMRQQDISNK
jgi:AraC-like DNA-binding protein